MTHSAVVTLARRPGWTLAIAAALVLTSGLVAASFVVHSTSGEAGGVRTPAEFLTDWQQTGVASSVTPAPVPVALSSAVGAPTRLPMAAASFALDAGVAGHSALEWTFSETVGMAVNQEVELAFVIHYAVGGVPDTVSLTLYVESQATAIAAALTFDLYWDAGAAAGVAFVSESQISQGCVALGSCP